MSTISVLVVDDSTFMQTALSRMISSDLELQVAGTAANGREALEKIETLQPDVVTLDLNMPGMDGMSVLRALKNRKVPPIIVISALTQEGAYATFEALSLGAFDWVQKPQSCASLSVVGIRDELTQKIHAAAQWGRRRRENRAVSLPSSVLQTTDMPIPEIVAIGCSTGGPRALQAVLPLLPADLSVPVLVVQHMPIGFTGPFANRLNALCPLDVREARLRDPIGPGAVLIAPAGWHLQVDRYSRRPEVVLTHEPANLYHRPSVDVMMLSVCERYGERCLGIILTGMGNDGAEGMRAIYQAGGITIGQDESTSTVYGMPRACAEMGVLRQVLPLSAIPQSIASLCRSRSAQSVS